jgi:enterochelin esterase-like enzyme
VRCIKVRPVTLRPNRRRFAVVVALAAVIAIVVAASGSGRSPRVHTGSTEAHGATILRYAIRSRYVHQVLPQTAVAPPGGGAGRPLLVFLHGRGGDGNESNSNGPFYAALAAQGARAPDVVFPNGGDHSYWHARSSGDWARYVLDEVIPEAVRRLRADPRRVAIGGISMGGFGAYDVARLRPREFCAVGGHSAALWTRAPETAPGAFDDAADFGRHDLIALARARGAAPWRSAALWLDGGSADPFRATDDALARALHVTIHHWAGGHDATYWDAHYRDDLRFYAGALAHCAPAASR